MEGVTTGGTVKRSHSTKKIENYWSRLSGQQDLGVILSLPLQPCSYRFAVTDHMGTGDLNLGPLPYTANILLFEPFPNSSFAHLELYFCFKRF